MKQLSQETAVARVTGARAFRAAQPALFVGEGADGSQYAFGILDDGRCAISRDGLVIKAWDYDHLGIDTAVDEYCAMMLPTAIVCHKVNIIIMIEETGMGSAEYCVGLHSVIFAHGTANIWG